MKKRGTRPDDAPPMQGVYKIEISQDMKISLFASSSVALAGLLFAFSPLYAAEPASENIALGKKVSFSAAPNYSYSTDPDDAIQLTDGQYAWQESPETGKRISKWVQKSTVGWSNRNPVTVTIDLEKIEPISGLSFSTAAGAAGVQFPSSISVAVSDDQKLWTYLGDLVILSNTVKRAPSYEEGYHNWRFATQELQARGRYVALLIYGASQYIFTDEIEVYRGDDKLLQQQSKGKAIPSLEEYGSQIVRISSVQSRLLQDIHRIEEEIRQAKLSTEQQVTLLQGLGALSKETRGIKDLPSDFRGILPINDVHRKAFALRGEAMAQRGFAPLTVWQTHRYAWLPLLAEPETTTAPKLSFSMLGNQFRSDSLLLTNASGEEQTIKVQLAAQPEQAQNGWLQIFEVEWTDTLQGIPVADALIPAQAENGTFTLSIPAGMTRKLWFLVDSSKLAPISFQSYLRIQNLTVPLQLDIAALKMSKPRLSLGMWDYTDGEGGRAITPQNREAAIQMMQSHYVDSTWATPAALPRPPATAFDKEGNLIEEPQWARLDEWLHRWPEARRYFVFASVGKSMAGAPIGTPNFPKRVGAWAKSLSAHIRGLGLQPSQLGILLIDEPKTDEEDQIIAAWAKAINAAAPELTLFSDTSWHRPDQAKIQDAITEMDILCPLPGRYLNGGKALQSYFSELQKQGKELWFYSCSGPIRLFSPQAYYRLQPRHAFAAGATGQGFWSFSDNSGASSSFTEYGTTRENFTPVFFDGAKIYSSVHWEAVREGMEDNEEMAMLQDRINQIKDIGARKTAQEKMDSILRSITEGGFLSTPMWSDDKDPGEMDQQQDQVRRMLLELSKK